MEESRREFIKKTCGLCAGVLGIASVLPLVQSCSSLLRLKTDAVGGEVSVPRSSFTAENNIVIVQVTSREFDIAVVQSGENSFKSFELQCTHQANSLVTTKSGFYCNAHGSYFSLEGKVQKPPALTNLREFPTVVTADEIKLKV